MLKSINVIIENDRNVKVKALQFLWGTKIREKRMLAKLKTTFSMGKLGNGSSKSGGEF